MSVHNSSYQGHSCTVTGAGEVKCMGYGGYGQLGDGSGGSSNVAVTVSGISNAVKVYTASSSYSTDYGHSCALLSNGQIKCWGYLASYGSSTTPVTISGISNAVDFSMSSGNGSAQDHWCAVLATGAVVCSGNGTYGAIGNG